MAQESETTTPVRRSALRPPWLICTSAALVILVLALGDLGLVLNLRAHALAAAARNLESSSTMLAAEADRAFQSVDLVLSDLIEKFDAAGFVDPASFDRALAGKPVHDLLKERLSGLPQLDALTVIDAHGKLVNFSRRWPIPDVSVTDRDYFAALALDPDAKRFVGAPVLNRGDGKWTIYLARRVDTIDGGFAGLVLGTMTVEYFEDFYRSVEPGETSAVTMLRTDGMLLARDPPSRLIGTIVGDPARERAFGGRDRGVLREASPIDGEMRLRAAAPVPNYPLTILVSMTEAEALGNWRTVALTLTAITGGCALAIAFAALMLCRWSRQQRVLALAREERAAAETARIKAEAELLRGREQAADAANRAKSNFLAMMSHEIRTPMNAVLALADTLLDDKMEPDKREIVESIRESGDTLLRILNDILDYSKLEAGQIKLETLAFAPAALSKNIVSIMGPRAAAKGLSFIELSDPDLPAALLGDADRIRQVLMNLASNALKFTQHGAITIETRCLLRDAEAATVEWTVKDTGIGIPPEKLRHLFDEFSQADTSITRRFGGTGLGLAISKRLIDTMAGTMTAASQEGKGTSFRFRLRLSLAPSPAAAAEEPEAGDEARLISAIRALGRPMRVLVAEDNPTNQFVVAQLLKNFDATLSLAHDGAEAVEEEKSGRYDLVLMDMQMPEMDGLEATRLIRKRGGAARLPIVGLTANAFAEDIAACREAGMDDVVVKPIKKARLIAAMLQALAAQPAGKAPAQRPGEPASAAAPVVDDAAMAALAKDLGPEIRDGLVAIFLSETRARLNRLAAAECDAASLLREIHSLAGAAGTAGAPALRAEARAAEERLRREGGTALPEGAALAEAFARFEEAVGARGIVAAKAA